jgi:hypothetical protein
MYIVHHNIPMDANYVLIQAVSDSFPKTRNGLESWRGQVEEMVAGDQTKHSMG